MYICIYVYICVFFSVRGPHIRVGAPICHLIDPSHAQFHSFHRLSCCGRTPACNVRCLFVCHLFVLIVLICIISLFVCLFVCLFLFCFEFFSFVFFLGVFVIFLQGMRACVFVCYARSYCVYSRCVYVRSLCPYRVSVSCA